MKFETLFSLIKDGMALDVNLWSAELGIEALEFCQYGQKIPVENSRKVSESSYWTTGIRKSDDESINSQIDKLLDVLLPKKNEINYLINKYNLESGVASFVWCGDTFNLSDIDFYLSSETVSRLADIQADFNVCIYQQ